MTTQPPVIGHTLHRTRPRLARPLTAVLAAAAVMAVGGVVASPAAQAATGCGRYSILPCTTVTVTTPKTLSFAKSAGGYKAGLPAKAIGTGFTMRLPGTNGGAYLPGRLQVQPVKKAFVIRATAGTMLRTQAQSKLANKQDNALGFGVAARGKITTITTSLRNLPVSRNGGEEAGIYFGPDDNNYVAASVTATTKGQWRVQLRREIGGKSTAADVIAGAPFNRVGATAKLRLTVNSATGAVSLARITGTTAKAIGTFIVPDSFVNGVRISPKPGATTAFTGLYATSRTAKVGPSGLAFTFGGFTVAAKTATVNQANALGLNNLVGSPYPNRLVFNTITYPTDSLQNVHDSSKLRVTNTARIPVRVASITTSGPFTVAGPTQPFTLAPGQSVDLTVSFGATTGAINDGSLVLTMADGTKRPVQLSGFRQVQAEGKYEPSFFQLMKVFGWNGQYPSSMTSLRGAYKTASPDEVLAPFWRKATNAPVSIRQVAAFHTYPQSVRLGRYNRGSDAPATDVFTQTFRDAQLLFPRKSNTNPTDWAQGSFNPTGIFGLKVNAANSDPRQNPQAPDRAKGCKGPICGQQIRAFKMRNQAGVLVPNTYIMTVNVGGENFDYQDETYVISNVVPVPLG